MYLLQNLEKKKIFKEFILISIIYIILTNVYFNFDQSLIFGAADGASYMKISENFPYFTENNYAITHNQRFLFPYIVGLFSFLLNLDHFISYRILITFLLLFLLFIFNKNLNYLKIGEFTKLIAFALIIFNPYLIRYYLALPTLINDLTFIISSQLILYGFFSKEKKFCYLGLIFSLFSRQTGIFFLITLLINRFYFKEKSFFSKKELFLSLILFLMIYYLNQYHANIASGGENLSEHSSNIFGMIYYLRDNIISKELLYFLSFPLLSWCPLILWSAFRKYRKKLIINEVNLFILLSTLLILSQPLLAGPISAGKNIIRLTNLAYPMMIIFILSSSFYKFKNIKPVLLIVFFIIFLIWSLHPTYSQIPLFKQLF